MCIHVCAEDASGPGAAAAGAPGSAGGAPHSQKVQRPGA